MSEKIQLSEKIAAVDLNYRSLWDEMDEEQQKTLKGELFILNRYISNVTNNNREIQEHFVLTVNEYYNRHWFELQKHPKLLWMLLCMCSYDSETVFFHEWISKSPKSTKKSNNKKINFLAELYPTMKMDEVQMLAELTSDKELKVLAEHYGFDKQEINKKLK